MEPEIAERWLYERLAADPELLAGAPGGVHNWELPQGTALPAVVYQHQDPGAGDVRAVGARRVMTSLLYTVKAVDRSASFGGVTRLAARIDALLDGQRAPVGGLGMVLSCVREGPFSMALTEGGVSYRQRGGIYRIRAQQQ